MKKAGDEAPAVELIVSGDGSHTLFVPGLNEHYHSVFGAIAESRHIYINSGFNYLKDKKGNIRILEIGFGTGLNALVTFLEALKTKRIVEYTSVEKFPLNEEVISKLNYTEFIDYPGIKLLYEQIHHSPWDQDVSLGTHFTLHKVHLALEDYIPEYQYFDLIYFDAFGPDVQPDMWTLEVFQKMAAGLKQGGVLVTYSTKGIVKRNLKEAGFKIEKLPGPAGKREIMRAISL